MNPRSFATKSPWHSALFAALGFAIASMLGLLVAGILLRSGLPDWILNLVSQYQSIQRLLLAIILFILGLALSGAVLGGVGGWLLSLVDPLAPRKRYIWAGAIAYAIPQVIIITIALLLAALIALYNNNLDTQPTHLPLLFGMFGLFYGILSGVLFGFLSVGFKYGWSVLLASMLSGLVGGAIVGVILQNVAKTVGAGDTVSKFWLIVALSLAFFGVTGAALGLLYTWFGRQREKGALSVQMSMLWRVLAIITAILAIIPLIGTVSQIYAFATMRPGSTSTIIPSKTIGVAWSAPDTVPESENANSPVIDMAASENDQLALVWPRSGPDASDIVLSLQTLADTDQHAWSPPLNVSASQDASSHPQIAVDSAGNWHVVWTETSVADEANSQILYARCTDAECTAPVSLSAQPPACVDGRVQNQDRADIAVDETDQIMVAWQTADGELLSTTWQASDPPSAASSDCVPVADQAWNPQLLASAPGQFMLAYDTAAEQVGDVELTRYQYPNWENESILQAPGHSPALYQDRAGKTHIAWCGNDQQLHYLPLSGAQAASEWGEIPKCTDRPAFSEDGYGRLHLIWHSDEITNNHGIVSTGDFLYDSARSPTGWTTPALIVPDGAPTAPVATTDSSSTIHVAWSDEATAIRHAIQPHYVCGDSTGSYLGDAILAVTTSGQYRPADEPIPFCQNQFDNFLYLPSPNPAFSEHPPTEYGGFDDVANEIVGAKYEVLFATMEWMKDENQDSPGIVLAKATADLYQQLKANPERYPRGVTVRILLGNYPEMATFTWGDQVWNVMDVLKKAGLPEMENPELGWKLELANFDGQIPHSHTKFLVADGEIVSAAGFNYSYLHLSEDHPSGQGVALVDLGMQMRGPVAQSALADYDDLWTGSDLVLCPDLDPPKGDWAKHCQFGEAEAEHVPEALLYHPTPDNDIAFSLLRTSNHPEGDDALEAVIRSSQDTIDIFEVNFSLEVYCALGVVMEGFCSMDDALTYTNALADVMEENGVKIRVLVTDVNMNGMENSVAIQVLQDELARRGISDQAEFRYYIGRMHPKAFLTDDKFLILGSQNFHYSAWGDGRGLAEHSLATDDPDAIAEFQRTFEYHWERGIPVAISGQPER